MDTDHLKIVVDGDGNAERETAARPTRQASQRLRPKKALPTDRAKFDTQAAALRAFVTASNRGEQAVGAADVAARISITEATAALVNNFFVEAGFLEKAGKGRYKPVRAVNEYQRLHGFDADEAAAKLAEPLRKSWYFTEVARELETGGTSETVLINVLARAAEAGDDRKAQLALILDWLEYSKLIVREDNGTVKLATDAEQPAGGDGGDPPDSDEPPAKPNPGPDGKGATVDRGKVPPTAPQVVGFSFDFSLTADDLRKLTPEQITATFEAVGKVIAIKAAMD